MLHKSRTADTFFIETKLGILTQTSDWFHITAEHIETFAPGLLENVSLEVLIREAQAWVLSAGSLSLILLYGLFFFINPWFAAILTLAFHWFWYQNKSACILYGAGPVLRVINSDIFMFVIAFLSLTLLSYRGDYAAVGIGIAYFFVMKPGLLRKGWDKLRETGSGELTLNDRVLKMVIIKRAMHENIAIADVNKMEEKLRQIAINQRKRD